MVVLPEGLASVTPLLSELIRVTTFVQHKCIAL